MEKIIAFVIHPTLYGEMPASPKEKRRSFVDAVLFYLLASGLIGIVLMAAWLSGYYTSGDVFKLQRPLDSVQRTYLLLSLALLFAPVIEEVAFRGLFTRNKVFSSLSLSLLTIVFLNFVYQQVVKPRYEIEGWIERLTTVVVMLVSWLYLYARRDYFSSIVSHHTRFFLMISVIGFSIVHLGNFYLSMPGRVEPFFLLPILALYAALAIALSYVRVKCGILWAIGMHVVHNGIVAIPLYRLFYGD